MRISRLPLLLLPLVLVACGEDATPIVEPPPEVDNPPTIALTGPAGGMAVAPGATVDITWTATDDKGAPTVDLTYTADGGKSGTITSAATGTSFSWTTPSEDLYGVKIQAVAKDSKGQTANAETSAIFAVVASSPRGYVTSSVCANCHAGNYEEVRQSGHPYKLNKVVDGKAPTYPFSVVPAPPTGYAWTDITYVIGGYGWKARFMDKDGYILTTGETGKSVQWNLPRPDLGMSEGWVGYETGRTEPKPYTCGTCHTTGWQTTADNGGVNQDGLKGIAGTWEEPGINCEQCHGAGATHVATKSSANINIDDSKEQCGSCHFRDTNHGILASGGFIKHHEQYDEMISAGHQTNSCTTCHDTHLGTRYGHAEEGGIKVTCESCHTTVTSNKHLVPVPCTTCHMPYASKSAQAKNDFHGDVKTHIFKLNSDAVGKSEMFYEEDGHTFTRGFVTLDFACYQCHKDPITGEGGTRSSKTLAELSAKAKGIHN